MTVHAPRPSEGHAKLAAAAQRHLTGGGLQGQVYCMKLQTQVPPIETSKSPSNYTTSILYLHSKKYIWPHTFFGNYHNLYSRYYIIIQANYVNYVLQ